MATPYHILIPDRTTGLLGVEQTGAAATVVSDLLQQDLESHHCFFNASNYHNHIVHHLLTLFGTGAAPTALQTAFSANAFYQKKASEHDNEVITRLQCDWTNASRAYLGKPAHYADFLTYFQNEIEKMGWRDALLEYIFKDDERSRDLFERLFSGFLHPMIHLLYGIEWEQPAIIAESLAQAAVHPNELGIFLTEVDAEAAKYREAGRCNGLHRSIPELYDMCSADIELATTANWNDPNSVIDRVITRSKEKAMGILAKIHVPSHELQEKTVEMFHTAAYVCAAAAFHPPHFPKFDFFLIHHVTSAPLFLSINRLCWIPIKFKVRLLEWKIRVDIVEYIARGCPTLDILALQNYSPINILPVHDPKQLLPIFHQVVDDGHIIKLARALLIAQEASQEFVGKPWIRIGDNQMWLNVHYMLLDGIQGPNGVWVRSAGFDEAWKDIPTM